MELAVWNGKASRPVNRICGNRQCRQYTEKKWLNYRQLSPRANDHSALRTPSRPSRAIRHDHAANIDARLAALGRELVS